MRNSVDLHNLATAYRYKKNSELRFTYYIFKVLQNPMLVRILSWLANGIIKYRLPARTLIKNTVFKIFCSGESINEAFGTIHKLDKYKVKSVLDYVAEGEENEQVFDENKEIIVRNIKKLGADAPGNSVSVKFTSLESPQYFRQINEFLLAERDFETLRFEKFIKRVNAICFAAHEQGVVLYFDAEDRNTQDIFDFVVEEMMERYNTKRALIYNTLQMYLTDRPAYLERLLCTSMQRKYFPGIKLVRGAYVEKERELAKKEGRVSPIFATKSETDEAFDNAIDRCLSEHYRVYTCIASHNEKSTVLALECIRKYGISDHYEKVKFSQLYGMRDDLTFNLGAGGFHSSKYLPYGEVKKAIPYLIRRAEENSSIGEQMVSEVTRLQKEFARRRNKIRILEKI